MLPVVGSIVWLASCAQLGASIPRVQLDSPSCSARPTARGVEVRAASQPGESFELRLSSIRRGELAHACAVAAPRVSGASFTLERGDGVRECWSARREGIEFHLELDVPFEGDGDLIASFEVESGLERATSTVLATCDGGLAWSSGDCAFDIGALAVSDASGRAIQGELRIVDAQPSSRGLAPAGAASAVGGLIDRAGPASSVDERSAMLAVNAKPRLELRVPAAFVDTATWPLRLDPLIGSSFAVSTPHPLYANVAHESDVAHEPASDRFLVVWREVDGSSGYEVRAQLFNDAGTKIGSAILLADAVAAGAPKVAAVRQSGRFVVAWQEGALVKCRAIRASDAQLSAVLTVSTSTSSNAGVDIAGDMTLADDDALLVWRDANGRISGSQVATTAASLSVVSTAQIVQPPFLGNLGTASISKSGGMSGRYCLVWEARSVAFPTPSAQYVGAQLFDRDLVALGAQLYLSSDDTLEESDPDVDGDGTQFVAIYGKGPKGGAAANLWAHSMRVSGDALASYSSETQLSGAGFRADLSSAVAFAGPKAFAAWVEQPVSSQLALRGRGIAPNGCVTCEATFDVEPTLPFISHGLPAIGGESGSPDSDRLLCTWQTNQSGAKLTIRGRLLEAFGPGNAPVDIGGACGNGGAISSSGTLAPGYPSFQVALAGADPASSFAVLCETFAPFQPVACGACVWEPFVMTWLHALNGGAAAHTFQVPCNATLVGVATRFQWSVYGTTQNPCAMMSNVSLSNRLECTFTQ